MAMILVCLLLSSANADDSDTSYKVYNYDDIEAIDNWLPAGTCQNLFYDCWILHGKPGGDSQCETCRENCQAACPDSGYDYPAADFEPSEYCGGRTALARTDCERLRILCYRRCEDHVSTEGMLPFCQSDCDNVWVKQCELKREYDLSNGVYDATQCLDKTKWPVDSGAGPCCEAIVYDAYVDQCWGKVFFECEEACYDGDGDIDACLTECDCYYQRGYESDDCAALGHSPAGHIPEVQVPAVRVPPVQVPPSLYVMGTLMAVLVACIAGLLCFSICVLPLLRLRHAQTKKYNFVGRVDEQQ